MNNFRRIFSFIVGSIVGTGVLLLPTTIANTGGSILISLFISTILFTGLGYLFSLTSTPFDNIKTAVPSKIFHQLNSIYYWVLSWSSTIIIIYEMTQAIIGLTGIANSSINIIIIQVIIVIIFTLIQKVGMNQIAKLEVVMTALKVLLLLGIPTIFIIYSFNHNLTIDYSFSMKSVLKLIPTSMWMFLGIESCSIISSNNKRSFPPILSSLATILAIYSFNAFSLLAFSSVDLNFPYQSILFTIFRSPDVSSFMSIVIILLCAGSTNSWFVMSARTLQSLPDIFPKKISSNYFYSVLASSVGLIPLAFFVCNPDSKTVFTSLLDYFSIFSSLFYLVSAYSITRIFKSFKVGIPVCSIFGAFFVYTLMPFITYINPYLLVFFPLIPIFFLVKYLIGKHIANNKNIACLSLSIMIYCPLLAIFALIIVR